MSTDYVCDPLKWKPPKRGFLKINCDGAWCPQSNIMGYAGLVRDDKGAVIWRLSQAGRARRVANWRRKAGIFFRICRLAEMGQGVVELDSIQVISGILAGVLDEQSKLTWSTRCSDLFSHRPEWELSHVWREANKGDDVLAKKACKDK
ncbi:hypothetical protein QQ045_006717 [Rhodiola kirilowii]